jgi:hypothetical protein
MSESNTTTTFAIRHGGDPYSVSSDGHYMGHDGFIVPKDLTELNRRFPKHISGFVRHHVARPEDWIRQTHRGVEYMRLSETVVADQDLVDKLSQYLLTRIPTFSPDAYGASAVQFFAWLARCSIGASGCSLKNDVSQISVQGRRISGSWSK